ncbi:MAG TPA: hypothetical protein VN836_05015 [Verrucomicrobiae bacterium]|nr:hypothetical protein [Verrucomicrobiae bacterium]
MKAIIPVIFAAVLLSGCVTPKIDWSARVGHYTYDQAVMEFGPPDRSAKLSDGSTVAEWLTQRGGVVVAPEPYFVPPGCYFGPLTPTYSETYVPARFLRLAFDANGELKTWKKFAR